MTPRALSLLVRPEQGGATARRAANEALTVENSAPFRVAVRVGFAARGLTYALIGAIALALAAGAGARPGGSAPNQEGALQLVAHAPLGGVVLAVVAAGLVAYALWKLTLAVLGTGPEGAGGRGWSDRLANLAGAIVYAAFATLAIRVLVGSAGNQTQSQRRAAGGVLSWPAGRELVAAAGVVLAAISAHQIAVAWRRKFAKDSKLGEMGEFERRVFLVLGRVGLIARALVFLLSGYFLVRTAIDYHPSAGIGIDGTLAQVHAQPFGGVLLALVGVGLLLFATFSAMEARRRRL